MFDKISMKTNTSIIENLNVIYFWKTTKNISNVYMKLATILLEFNITLVPLETNELSLLKKNKRVHLMILRNDILSASKFNDLRINYIESSMASGKIMVYDVSSFSLIENAASKSKKISYKIFKLPLELSSLGAQVAVEFFKEKSQETDFFINGNRSKLPLSGMRTKN